MASVGYDKEIGSFAVAGAVNRKKFYYVGTICGTGGDDEICLSDVRRITYNEYLMLRKGMIDISNKVVNDRINTRINLIKNGWLIGYTIEELENERAKYLK